MAGKARLDNRKMCLFRFIGFYMFNVDLCFVLGELSPKLGNRSAPRVEGNRSMFFAHMTKNSFRAFMKLSV